MKLFAGGEAEQLPVGGEDLQRAARDLIAPRGVQDRQVLLLLVHHARRLAAELLRRDQLGDGELPAGRLIITPGMRYPTVTFSVFVVSLPRMSISLATIVYSPAAL
jgi:hypothetical protein